MAIAGYRRRQGLTCANTLAGWPVVVGESRSRLDFLRTICGLPTVSDAAAAAAWKAADLAVAWGARPHIISAYGRFEAETFDAGSDHLVISNETDAERIAAEVADELRSSHPGLNVTSAASPVKPGEALVREADTLGADLIVVGMGDRAHLGPVRGPSSPTSRDTSLGLSQPTHPRPDRVRQARRETGLRRQLRQTR